MCVCVCVCVRACVFLCGVTCRILGGLHTSASHQRLHICCSRHHRSRTSQGKRVRKGGREEGLVAVSVHLIVNPLNGLNGT